MVQCCKIDSGTTRSLYCVDLRSKYYIDCIKVTRWEKAKTRRASRSWDVGFRFLGQLRGWVGATKLDRRTYSSWPMLVLASEVRRSLSWWGSPLWSGRWERKKRATESRLKCEQVVVSSKEGRGLDHAQTLRSLLWSFFILFLISYWSLEPKRSNYQQKRPAN